MQEAIATILEEENIYVFLELLRKKGFKIYIMNWASNTKSKFIVTNKLHRGFDILVDDVDATSKSNFSIVENGAFLDNAICFK